MVPLETTAPPAGLLEEELYLVNSGFYHPESLMRVYPTKSFIGLPIDAGQLEDFLGDYPQARTVLWRSFSSVQDDVREALLARAGTTVVRTRSNDSRIGYTVLALGESGGAEER